MLLRFKHQGKTATAVVVFDFTQIDAFSLMPINFKTDLGEKIFFYKKKIGWETDILLSETFPETCRNIIAAIEQLQTIVKDKISLNKIF